MNVEITLKCAKAIKTLGYAKVMSSCDGVTSWINFKMLRAWIAGSPNRFRSKSGMT